VLRLTGEDFPFHAVELDGNPSIFRLDGLSKPLDSWDLQYYMGEFRSLCSKEKMNELQWPRREYIVQVARFDPAKGIPDVIDSYARLRKLLEEGDDLEDDDMPQLLVCGHGAVDDPDASIIYDQVMQLIMSPKYKEYAQDIVVMRLPPSDQRKLSYLQICVGFGWLM
jgi:hypothetical protein